MMTAIALTAVPMAAQEEEQMPGGALEPAGHAIVPMGDIMFEPIEVPGFDSGMEIAVIHGDPMAAAGDYTLRLAFPDGYRFPSHYHPVAEHLTVLEGTFLLAMGATIGDDSTLAEYGPGVFLYLPARDPHYGGATGETVIQLHGQAPFEILLSERRSRARPVPPRDRRAPCRPTGGVA